MAEFSKHTPIKGIVPPMVTPLSDRNLLDVAGLTRLIEHLITGGVHGLFILGTTGEGASLSYQIRMDFIERTCKQVAGRIPVLVGITDTIFAESVEIATKAARCGANALVLAPPYYFQLGQQEMLDYLEDMTKEISLPLYLYNMPHLTKFFFEIDTVVAASKMPKIVGMKDSSGDMVFFHKLKRALKHNPDFSIFTGREELLAESLLLGADGGITGGAMINPKPFVELYKIIKSTKNLEEVEHWHNQILEIGTHFYGIGRYGSSMMKGIKSALSCMGICEDALAEPFRSFKEKERKIVLENLIKMKLINKESAKHGTSTSRCCPS